MTTPEALTEAERSHLEALDAEPFDLTHAEKLAIKLLRIHDALQARVKELEATQAWRPCCGACGHAFPSGPGQYTATCPACGAAWDGSEIPSGGKR